MDQQSDQHYKGNKMKYIAMVSIGFIELFLFVAVMAKMRMKTDIDGWFTVLFAFGLGWITFKVLGWL